jgi:hypothetical protein
MTERDGSRIVRRVILAAAGATLLAIAVPAHADEIVATGALSSARPGPDTTPLPSEPDVDIIGSVRAGLGWSELMRSRILSLSFEDQLQVHRLSDELAMTVIFGMDGQRPLDGARRERSFWGVTLGPGLLLHAPRGPAFTLGATASPLFQSKDDSTKLAGFGVGVRVEAYPLYQSLVEAVECDRGTFSTYVLSGLHGWAQTRRDWLGFSGESYAVGFGFDLGRNVLLPILGAALHGSCAARDDAGSM